MTGTSTIGSSEAAMLGGLAMKWRWRQRRAEAGLGSDRPNLVMGINVQVCWEKFCRYWDVEPRFVAMDGSRFHLGVDEALGLCDENTIGVVAIMGSTYDGSYEPVADLSIALDELHRATGLDIPIHVDAASGGFVAPFLQPDVEWDFRLERVVSINASGHKFGLVYPGVGWIIWRDRDHLPDELVFTTNYLGGPEPTTAINFSCVERLQRVRPLRALPGPGLAGTGLPVTRQPIGCRRTAHRVPGGLQPRPGGIVHDRHQATPRPLRRTTTIGG